MSRPKNKEQRTKYGTSLKISTVEQIKLMAIGENKNENNIIEEAISHFSKVNKLKKIADKHGKTFDGFIDEAVSRYLIQLSTETLANK